MVGGVEVRSKLMRENRESGAEQPMSGEVAMRRGRMSHQESQDSGGGVGSRRSAQNVVAVSQQVLLRAWLALNFGEEPRDEGEK